jgi:hypothetical protein
MAPAAEWERAGADAVHIPGLAVIMWNAWQAAGHLGLLARQPNLDLLWAALALVAAVLLGVAIIVWVQRWRKRAAELTDPDAELTNYRALFEQGLLSAEEWERIRARLEGKKPQATPPAPPANGPPQHGPPDPPPGQGMP